MLGGLHSLHLGTSCCSPRGSQSRELQWSLAVLQQPLLHSGLNWTIPGKNSPPSSSFCLLYGRCVPGVGPRLQVLAGQQHVQVTPG